MVLEEMSGLPIERIGSSELDNLDFASDIVVTDIYVLC